MLVYRLFALLYADNRSYQKLLRVGLEVQEVVCAQRNKEFLESLRIGLVEEEFLPEAFGFFYLFFLLG